MICEWCRRKAKYRYNFCIKLYKQGRDITDTCPFKFLPKEEAELHILSMKPKKGKRNENKNNEQ
jgi:hypothetical protein